ncbi:MAG TPA: hydroxymethylglutaryl-CoA reductase, degradative [Terrimesophilobacter sp.]|uniref:hydroxymethylglutaryl-CoA reductase, degradative n=1 Tax=Terrimesophilobacter sp. TaxID=2906435 RepID=UPI002F92680A
MTRSRIPRFYQLSVEERLRELRDRGAISKDDYDALSTGSYILNTLKADRLTENVIGVFSMPMGLGLNLTVNGRDHLVPMVVEEPSIIAAVSSAARLVRRSGGFSSTADTPLIIGQVQVLDVADPLAARRTILESKQRILDLANSAHPNMVARGGGALDVEVHLRGTTAEHGELLVVHLVVDSRDAMGANLVNTMCEAVAPLVEELSGGRVFLRILSNLSDRAMVRSRVVIPSEKLATEHFTGEQVRDGIVLAGEFAELDVYRATTHNKGIMNGIDAVAIATGNDWRAIEAAAHAFAASTGRYRPLTRWSEDGSGNLVGEIELPLKVGTVGGQMQSNPVVRIAHDILGAPAARELAEIMAAVGLAQNLAALKALSTEGIQPGHMRLHARSVAVAAGVSEEQFEEVVDKLVASGDIKVWKAQKIIETLNGGATPTGTIDIAPVLAATVNPAENVGYGKIILLGEHSVVYGRHAIAAPLSLAIRAEVTRPAAKTELVISGWDSDPAAHNPSGAALAHKVADLIARRLGVAGTPVRVEVFPELPRASGLGASAALAVSVIRALAHSFGLRLSEQQISDLAFECEQLVHGTPSGIDNTVATFGSTILFRRTDAGSETEDLAIPVPVPVVVGLTGVRSLTADTVGRVHASWQKNPRHYEAVFSEIDELVMTGVDALRRGDLAELGDVMNLNHGLLNALQVSSPALETIIDLARRSGALGAKLTGGGGGGAMIAIAEPGRIQTVANTLDAAGYQTYLTEIRTTPTGR